jgi:hypothetical protein
VRGVPILRYSLLSPLFYASLVISVVYGLSTRFGQSVGGFWDVVLRVYLSSTVFALLVLPLWLIFLVIHNRWQSRAEFLIRHGSFLKSWWVGVKDSAANWLALTFAWVIGLYASAIGLPVAAQVADAGGVSTVIASGVHPIWVMVGQIVVETGFAITIAALIRAFDIVRFSMVAQILTGVTIFAWFTAGASGALPNDALINLSRYVQVQLFLTDPPAAVLALLLEGALIAVFALAMRAADRAALLMSAPRWLNLLLIHWVISAFLIAIRLCAHVTVPLEASAVLALSGNAGTAIDALTWSFIYCGAGVVLVVTRMPSTPGLLDLQLLRTGSTRAWVIHTFRHDGLVTCLFSITVAVPGVVAYYALGGPGPTFTGATLLLVWALIVTVSFHGWLLMSAAVFGLILIRSAAGAFGAAIVIFVVTLIPQAPSTRWPFGAANLARVAFGASSVFLGTVSIIVTTVLILFATAALSVFQRRPEKRKTLWAR